MALSSFSPRLRTGVVLCGSGTAGAYHAGALRAMAEAGVKVDVIGAHGAGVATALVAAIDGGPRVWDASGPWTSERMRKAYRWTMPLRVAFAGLLVTGVLLLAPLALLVVAAFFYALATLAALVSLTGASARAIGWYQRVLEWLFEPPILPTILPRLLVLAVLVIVGVLAVAAWKAFREEQSRRRRTGAFWWRLLGSPVDGREPAGVFIETIWDLVRGASNEPRPTAEEIGRRYVDLLADNFGQPGFHELILAVHDIDGRRDLVCGVLDAASRTAFENRQTGPSPREAEIVDFTGPQRELLTTFLSAALRPPVVTAPAVVAFPTDSFWQGERHRVCDRPELVTRVVDELVGIGIEQIVLIGPCPPPASPHAMRAHPIDLRGRIGEIVRSMESAALTDAVAAASGRLDAVFVIRPDHNPIGPFACDGVYDEASDRQRSLAELIEQGYADAYRYFIDVAVVEN